MYDEKSKKKSISRWDVYSLASDNYVITTKGNSEPFFPLKKYEEKRSNYGIVNGRYYCILCVDILDLLVGKQMVILALFMNNFAQFFWPLKLTLVKLMTFKKRGKHVTSYR